MTNKLRLILIGDAHHLTQGEFVGLMKEDFLPGYYMPD
ncbi:hypothetical protein BH10PSE4_BH10PSE4_37250 [soil metagenome]